MRLTETHIHIAARRILKDDGWRLVAGQYPGGSDDECSTLYIVDPAVARDRSPDPRRHSDKKQVPDIVALRGEHLLIIEAKPDYSFEDRAKLVELLEERRSDLKSALEAHFARLRLELPRPLVPIPCLAFAASAVAPWRDAFFAHILVRELRDASLRLPASIGLPL